ncbi:MAG TPA: TolC family protein, partial [Marinobacter sp.]
MSILPRVVKPVFFGALVLTAMSGWATPTLELSHVINAAIENDPWLRQSGQLQAALLDEAVAEGALPDPRVTISAANLPTDTFDTGQEAMTQATIGVTQRIPRGESRQLARAKQ